MFRRPMKLRNNHLYYFIMLATLLLPACENKTVYHSFLPVPNEGWNKNDTLVFTFPVYDTIVPLNFSIETRNTEKYPFTNLFLIISSSRQRNPFVTLDTLECTLANEKGRWKGTGIGGIYQNTYPYRILSLPSPDTLTIRINHAMSTPLLKGIKDIGLYVHR